MRRLTLPSHCPLFVFNTCINSKRDKNLKTRLKKLETKILSNSNKYIDTAKLSELYMLQPFIGKANDIVIEDITKEELTNLYDGTLVSNTKPRNIYNTIKGSAPDNRCPYCEIGHAETLDHYLPQSEFPLFSITPSNLVPSCNTCNKSKNSKIPSKAEEQSIHPYFDHNHLTSEIWISAKVTYQPKLVVVFYVSPPENWSPTDKKRVTCHFSHFNLAERYSNESASDIAILESIFNANGYDTAEKKKVFLKNTAADFMKKVPKDSCRIALYQALSESDEYCSQPIE